MISHAFTLILALKAVQASDTTGNTQRVNITLGFVSYYCSIRNTEYNSSLVSNYTTNFDPILVNIEDNSGVAYYDDLGMLAAVERVNNDPTILPGVHVNIKRFSDCGTYDPNAAADYAGDSAGFASAVTAWDIAEVHKDVVGVISNEYSTVTAGIAEILSASMIPMCGTCAGSPRMSNKETYPYYWRMLSADYSRQMLLILEKWNVKRVGIIYQDDSEIGLQLWKAMKREFAQVAISVVATVKLSRNFDKAAANYTTQALQSSDCRYIIISGTGAFVASILASQSTLIGSKWVWMSYNFPQANGDPTQLYGPDFYSYLRGFIIVGDIKTTPNELYHQLNNMAGSILAHDSFVENCVCEAYDCTMMMLLGFDKVSLQDGF
ncbi:periplasmic binding protein-like I [Chytriomyces sp. MP71]|nr:periplasmic binding protein-like I [Chytriomyces sp. MP71]